MRSKDLGATSLQPLTGCANSGGHWRLQALVTSSVRRCLPASVPNIQLAGDLPRPTPGSPRPRKAQSQSSHVTALPALNPIPLIDQDRNKHKRGVDVSGTATSSKNLPQDCSLCWKPLLSA